MQLKLAIGSIFEEVHDSLGFPIDIDCEGNLCHRTSKSLIFARSQPITTIDALKIRKEKAIQNLEESGSDKIRELQKERTTITQVGELSQLLFISAGIPSSHSESLISDIPYEIIGFLRKRRGICEI